MNGLFPNIFHGERSELREKYGLEQLSGTTKGLLGECTVANRSTLTMVQVYYRESKAQDPSQRCAQTSTQLPPKHS
jgi:hypothetical protein